jgi:hypothetical protein
MRKNSIKSTRVNRRREIESIASRLVYSYNVPGHEGTARRIESEWFKSLKQHKVGDRVSVDVGSPGSGFITYVITKFTRNEVLAFVERDRSYICTVADVI